MGRVTRAMRMTTRAGWSGIYEGGGAAPPHAPTWRVFPARPALHNIPKFTKFPNITTLLNKLIVKTMHPL